MHMSMCTTVPIPCLPPPALPRVGGRGQAPEAGRGRRQQLGQPLGEQGLQSLPQAGVVALQLAMVLLLVWPNQGLVLAQRILAPGGRMARCSGTGTQERGSKTGGGGGVREEGQELGGGGGVKWAERHDEGWGGSGG